MNASIARQVALRGTALLVGSLVVAGIGTAVVLHIEAIHAVDGMLLSAAQGHDTPEADEPWHSDQGHHRVDAWEVEAGDRRLPRGASPAHPWSGQGCAYGHTDPPSSP